mmetsp:Transcript_16462/g.49151  ORF Transcript_16462/g.49151 Transcript_16462/m.49151 type:complete len:226 (-) Transcript_16462:2131-2808(-)
MHSSWKALFRKPASVKCQCCSVKLALHCLSSTCVTPCASWPAWRHCPCLRLITVPSAWNSHIALSSASAQSNGRTSASASFRKPGYKPRMSLPTQAMHRLLNAFTNRPSGVSLHLSFRNSDGSLVSTQLSVQNVLVFFKPVGPSSASARHFCPPITFWMKPSLRISHFWSVLTSQNSKKIDAPSIIFAVLFQGSPNTSRHFDAWPKLVPVFTMKPRGSSRHMPPV